MKGNMYLVLLGIFCISVGVRLFSKGFLGTFGIGLIGLGAILFMLNYQEKT